MRLCYGKSIKMSEKSWKSKIQWLVDFDGKKAALFRKNARLRLDRIKGMV